MQALAHPLSVPVVPSQTNKKLRAGLAHLTITLLPVKLVALQYLQVSTLPNRVLSTLALLNAVKPLTATGATTRAQCVQMATSALKRVSFIGGSKVALVAPTASQEFSTYVL